MNVLGLGGRGLGGDQLIAASMWSLVLRGAGMLATFVLGILLARILGPAELGVYGLIIAIAMLLAAVAQLGLPTLATREVALAWFDRRDSELVGILLWFAAATAAAGCVLGATFVVVAQLWPDIPRAVRAGSVPGAVLVALFALTVLVSAELRAMQRLVLGQSLELFVRPLVTCVLLIGWVLLIRSFSVQVALLINVLAALVALVLALRWLLRELPPEASRAEPHHHIRKWARSAAPLALTDVLRQLDGVYALLLMGILTTNSETGLFRVAQSTMLLFATPLFVVHVVVAPTLARLHGTGQSAKLQKLVAISAALNLAAAAAATLLVFAAGPSLIALVFGDAYRSSWLPLLILCVSQTVNGFFGVGFVLLPMAGAERELTIAFAVSVAASLVVTVPMIIFWGANGAACGAVVGALMNGMVCRHYAQRRMEIETSLLAWRLPAPRGD